jgi:hypothetical protein
MAAGKFLAVLSRRAAMARNCLCMPTAMPRDDMTHDRVQMLVLSRLPLLVPSFPSSQPSARLVQRSNGG